MPRLGRQTPKLTKIETETIISFNMAEDFATIATRMQRIKTKLAKLGITPYRKQADQEVYRVPNSWIRINPPKKLSEKERQRRAQVLKERHAKSKKHVSSQRPSN